MSAPLGNPDEEHENVCVCGKSYRTSAGLSQHKRRYCRGPIETNQQNKCEFCERSFKSFTGLRLHISKSHKTEYNNEMEQESLGKRRLWAQSEVEKMAFAEANYKENDLLDYLVKIVGRTKDAIKGKRKTHVYKDLVMKYMQNDIGNNTQENLNENHTPLRSGVDGVLLTNNLVPLNNQNENEDPFEMHLKNLLMNNVKEEIDKNFINELLQTKGSEQMEVLNKWTSVLIRSIQKKEERKSLNINNKQKTNVDILEQICNGNLSKRKTRTLQYKYCQRLIKQDRKRFSNRLLDDLLYVRVADRPNNEDIIEEYGNIFGQPSPGDNEPVVTRSREVYLINQPINNEEIKKILSISRDSASGPDRITLSQLIKISTTKLEILYNAMLLCRKVPEELKKCRTTLIPKGKTELKKIKNWRPITITSMLLRICNKIVSKRMNSIKLDCHQKGFCNYDGCFENCMILQTIIKKKRQTGQPLTIISLDLQKAFDTISIDSIERALYRLNVNGAIKEYIIDNFKDCETTLSCMGETIGTIKINRGVKQGDPLSPFIFNAVMDELICSLNVSYGCKFGNNKNLSCLAYADDLLIFADNQQDATELLNAAKNFFDKRKMKLNVDKCKSMVAETVPGKKKVYIRTKPAFSIDGKKIPTLAINEVFRYLGHRFSAFGETKCNNESLFLQLGRLTRAPLKPQQKIIILNNFLIPRYISFYQNFEIDRKTLNAADKLIRNFIKRTLHLCVHCNNAVLYAPKSAGGLGIFNFRQNIPAIISRRLNSACIKSNLLADVINISNEISTRFNNMLTENVTDRKKIKERNSKDLELSFSGNGMFHAGNNFACSSYIYEPPVFWNGESYIRAIQLRLNLLPCMSIPSNPTNLRKCRAGCDKNESLSHILQNCPLTHWPRIARHDWVMKRIIKHARFKGWIVKKEPHIRSIDGALKKPDILFAKDDKVIICDVGISWEGPIGLNLAYSNKVAIYSDVQFIEALKKLFPDKNIYILPFILGARGTWCKKNKDLDYHLEFTKKLSKDLITTVLRGGIIIHKHFMKFVWR